MNELDLLKTHWQKEDDYIKFKKEDIVKMVHKSSSSIVKWIFIICCLEFVIWLSLFITGLVLNFTHIYQSLSLNFFMITNILYDIVFYIVIIYFIYQFYVLHSQINNENNTITLLQNIIEVRNNTDKYIRFNLLCVSISLILNSLKTLYEKYNEGRSWGELIFFSVFIGIFIPLIWLLLRKIFKLYYKLLYGILLKKLNKNYEELIKIEQ